MILQDPIFIIATFYFAVKNKNRHVIFRRNSARLTPGYTKPSTKPLDLPTKQPPVNHQPSAGRRSRLPFPALHLLVTDDDF